MVMVIVPVMVVGVVIGLFATAGTLATGLGALDGGLADEELGAEDNAAADGLAGLGVLGERGVFDGLEDLVATGFLAGAGNRFVDVGDHGRVWSTIGGWMGDADLCGDWRAWRAERIVAVVVSAGSISTFEIASRLTYFRLHITR